MAKKKIAAAKKPAQEKQDPARRLAAMEREIKRLRKLADELKTKAPDDTPPARQHGVLLYLRNASRHWPRKIRSFLFCPKWEKWLYRGGPIPIQQWNEEQEAILDDIETYEFPSPTGILVIELEPPQEAEVKPNWEKGLEAARKAKQEQNTGPVTEEPDERQRPPERPVAETLY